LPNTMASVGIAIIVASGLYIVFREQAIGRRTASAPVPDHAVQTPAE
jgi:hypothetical protein